eukprot:TRINITY_DN5348_c0_g1_i1.p1 TRINITY_DN5348_c0_g1~~TRINITY_DN5348_c0_g1_i1.p1  ORF type:complete len:751 (+),score=207.84 TRINITY_DN5348_c0_g1_i1:101-2254(+)
MQNNKVEYPVYRREDCTDNPNKVPDPYRYLEDSNGEETKKFVEDQNKLFEQYMGTFDIKDKLKNRMTELYNYPKYSCTSKRGEGKYERYYFYKNDGLQNQSVLYSQNKLNEEAKVFLDPNTLSKDGTAAIQSSKFSESGRYFAYCLSQKGSDWSNIYVIDCETNDTLKEKLDWVKFSSITWHPSEEGFFYCRYEVPKSYENDEVTDKGTEVDANANQKVYYHKLHTEQSSDVLVYDDPKNPQWMFGVDVSDDNKYLFLTTADSCDPKNQVHYCELSGDKAGFNKDKPGRLQLTSLVDIFDASYEFITNNGSLCYFKTNKNAPKDKVITIDLANPQPENWKVLIPEHETDVLSLVFCVNNDKLVIAYMHDVKDVMYLHNLEDGKRIKQFDLEVGTLNGYSGRRKDNEFFFGFTSFLTPSAIYNYSFEKDEVKLFRRSEIPGYNPDLFTTQQIFYPSKDGTKIPLFIVHKKGIKLDGNNPTYLYGYGGFNVSIQPYFSTFRVVLMQNLGCIFAVANIRGGGEYGVEWHNKGKLGNKQNVFDDFCAAAEYLIDNKYTRPEKLAISGGSNGGLLVAACANQRPELFGCVIPQVGVLDMLRFHKFTIGYAWCSDFGNPDKESDFEFIYKYSPLHNVQKDKKYPAMLFTTGSHDDRVSPLHTFKMVAELQHWVSKQTFESGPILSRIEVSAGHGAGKPTSKIIDEIVEIYSFITKTLKLTWTD